MLDGYFYLWPTSALSVGQGIKTRSHFNHTLQITIVVKGRIRTRANRHSRWREGEALLTLPHTTHESDFSESIIATVYLDIENEHYNILAKALTMQNRDSALLEFPASSQLTGMKRLATDIEDRSCSEAGELRDRIVDYMRDRMGVEDASKSNGVFDLDPRIRKVKEYVYAHLQDPIDVATLAGVAALSTGRLMVLFKRELGLTVRRFVLGARMKAAVRAAAIGMDITQAAMAGGFSDSAHFSHAFSQFWGIKPTKLFRNEDRKIRICSDY